MSVPPLHSAPPSTWRKDLLACLALVLSVAAAFGGLYRAGFINLDDFEYVKYNVHLAQGFTWANLKWAFTPGYASNWHPLTWMSHMLDYQLFGLNPAWHHVMNIAFHAANAVVLFLFLRWLTSRFWESLLVAALFALHPLRVESVAWIAERKDVLSTLLILLCIWSYARYARAQTSRQCATGSYIASLILFALALMAKPMSVTVPFVLLLLDFWPFERWLQTAARSNVVRILLEKVPFLVMTVITCILTLKAQTHAMTSLANYSLSSRVANAVAAYAAYLRKMVWPTDLSIMYPLAEVPLRTLLIGVAVVAVVIGVSIDAARKRPYITFGCFLFLGMLVPTIGLVHVGAQSFADRYTYLPTVGILIAVVWWAADIIANRALRVAAYAATVVAVVSFGICTRYETGYWRNSITLFTHGLKNTTNNFFLVSGMASVLDDSDIPGISKESAFYYKWAFMLNPKDMKLNHNYGNFWARRGFYEKALTYYDNAMAARKDDADVYFDKANALAILAKFPEAETNFKKTLEIDPTYVNAEVNYAGLFAIQHRYDESIPHYDRALALAPRYAKAHHLMGVTLARMGRMAEAVEHFKLAVKYFDKPDPVVWNDLAWMLAVMQQPSLHDPAEAVHLAQIACDLNHRAEPGALDTLAVAYAEAGKFDDAAKTADKVIELARLSKRPDLLAEMERRKQLYLNHKPYRPEVVTEDRPVKSMLDLTPRK